MKFEEYLDSLAGKTVAVIGIGVSNQPLIELLADLEDALPSWALNGWSPREMRRRMEDETDAAPEREGEPEAA